MKIYLFDPIATSSSTFHTLLVPCLVPSLPLEEKKRNIVSSDETFARHERLPDPSGVNEETRHRSSRAERNNFKRGVEGRCLRFHGGCQPRKRFLLFLPSSSPFSLPKDTCQADKDLLLLLLAPRNRSRSRDTIPAITIVSVDKKGDRSGIERAHSHVRWMNLVDFILQIFFDNVRS